MSAITTLYLARHGQSEMNNQKRITGQLDVGLTPQGVAQAAALARLLAHVPLAAIYTSALDRAVQSAAPAARNHGLTVVREPAFNEIHMGVLQGCWRDERDPEAAALWRQWREDMWHFRVPQGEAFAQLHARAGAALTALLDRHQGQEVLVVAHRCTNRILLGMLLGLAQHEWPGLRPSNKIVHRIVLRGARALEHTEMPLPKNVKHASPVHAAA